MRPQLQNIVTRILSASPSFQQQKHLSSDLDNGNSPAPSDLTPIPGGSPFSLCPVSSSTDLFTIEYVEVNQQPVHIDDEFVVNIYGTFRETWIEKGKNATIEMMGDCGSHCEDYGHPPDSPPETFWKPGFCEMTEVMQPLGRHMEKNETGCPPPVQGWALLSVWGYVWPMELNVPGWYNFTFDAKTPDGRRIYCLTTEVCLRWENEDRNKGYPPGPWTNCTWPR